MVLSEHPTMMYNLNYVFCIKRSNTLVLSRPIGCLASRPEIEEQGGILGAKVLRIWAGSLELSGEVLIKNDALLLRF